ncbi:MAG TPA: hypothetical protein VF656_18930 [Pyrinomonadaceae bacterium]|jgi:hypothetical protein
MANGLNLNTPKTLINVPIPQLPTDREVWLAACITSVRSGTTRHGDRYYDASAYNGSGRVSLKVWGETIRKCGELRPGVYGLTGKISFYQEKQQLVVSDYREISVEEYKRYQLDDPVLPRAFVLDIETLPLTRYQERARMQLERALRLGSMPEAQRLRYEANAPAEEERVFASGALSPVTGRMLCVSVHIAPKAYFDAPGLNPKEHTFGIDEGGKEQPESAALEGFLTLMKEFDPDSDEIVAHNVNFDMSFIFFRCVVHGLGLSFPLDLGAYNPKGVYDTSRRWAAGARSTGPVSLDALAWALGEETSKSEEVCGDRVLDLYRAGALGAIRDYNLRDVRLTRKIYERLVKALSR